VKLVEGLDLATLCPLAVPDALARSVALAPNVEAIFASDGRRPLRNSARK